jgi:hypothetical protein
MSHWHLRKSRTRKFRPEPAVRSFAPQRAAARPAGSQPDLLDPDRAAFIRALDAADFDLPDWDAEFTGSMFQRLEKRLPLTDKMRAQIDRLMNRYRGRVKWGNSPVLGPVRSTTREAYVPDEAAALLTKANRR